MYNIESRATKLEALVVSTFFLIFDMKRHEAEITIAQVIGEIRQLIMCNLLCINPKLSYEQILEKAEDQVKDIFYRLENAYKDYFSD